MGVRDLFDRPGYAEFFREISNNADSLVHVSHVTAGTTIVATNLGLHFRDRYYHILASLTDGEFARFSPGALHLRELMRYAIEAGCNQFDFTIGDESYKSDWADTRLDLYDHVSATNWLGWIATRSLAFGLDVKRHIKRSPVLWKCVGMLRSVVGSFASRKTAKMRDQDAQSQSDWHHLRTARDDAAISLTRSLKVHPAGITVEAQEILLRRYAGNAGFTTKIEDRSSLQAILPHWHDLAERSAENNVHYAPNYALALLDSVDAAKHVRFVTVWDGNDLMAFLPVVTRVPIPGVTASGSAWATDYTNGCTPLIDRDRFLDASHGLVEGLAKLTRGEWVIPKLNENGIVAKSIIDALDYRQAPWAMRESFQRALLHTGDSFESHMKTHIGSKRRRKLERNRRRLEECGTVSFRTYTSGDDLDGAVEDFLRIEASGWKGKRGTALGCKPDTAEFARRAFGSNGIYAKSRVDLLLLNDESIAAGVIVFSGETAFSVKGGYDERYAVWGAGLLLEVEILKSFLTEKWATRLDSATYGPHAIDRLWPDRMSVADLTFSFAPAMAQPRLSAYNHVQDFKSVIKRPAKRFLGRN